MFPLRSRSRANWLQGRHERDLFTIGDWPVHTGEALLGFAALALILLLTIAVIIARSGSRGAALAMAQAIRADELEERVSEMLRAQSEATGRVHEMGQALAGRQADMARAVNERLDWSPIASASRWSDHPQHHG